MDTISSKGKQQEMTMGDGSIVGGNTTMERGTTTGSAAMGDKREVATKSTSGFQVKDLILVAVLLAAGLVLKMTVGSMLSFGGMKPNFMIAMYCLAILLVRPKPYQALIIGVITGVLCQLSAATPLINLASEPLGALACSLLIMLPLQFGRFDARPIIATFLSTAVSGYTFAAIVVAMTGAAVGTLFTYYAVMVLGTAALNTVIVAILYVPLKKALGK